MNEIIFGLIMVLTFTCTISAATGGHEELSTILWSALGCNVAWGFVDSMMYIFSILLERGETLANVRRIRSEKTDTKMKEALKDSLPPLISQLLKEEHIAHLGKEIRNLPEPPAKTFLTWHDIRDAALIFLMVFLSTFPVTLPFVFIKNVALALRVSNGIALLLLFLTGVYLGKQTGHHKILFGGLFASIGIMLVAVTIALGG